jgi:hypothetical protein
MKIKSIKKINSNSLNYDISVPKTNNFYANGILVHNCTSMYRDHIHARSLDSKHHPSRDWIKRLHAQICYDIPEGYRICGENMFAYHSIYYANLPTYFFVYGIYDDKNNCLNWDETKEFCEILGLHTVPTFYEGIWDEAKIKKLWTGKGTFETYASAKNRPKYPDDFGPCDAEGYVCRLRGRFHYDDFSKCCAKFVGADFRRSMRQVNWQTEMVIPNQLVPVRE